MKYSSFYIGIVLTICASSCITYRPLPLDFSALKGKLIVDSKDSLSFWSHAIHPDTADELLDYGMWFFGYSPPKATDNILNKGYQPYYINIRNEGQQPITLDFKNQTDFFHGKYFHKKTRNKLWLHFGVSTGSTLVLSALVAYPFAVLIPVYTLPTLFYNLSVNGSRKSYLNNLSPSKLTIEAGKTDSLLLFAKLTDRDLHLQLSSNDNKAMDITVPPATYKSRFFKINGLNAMAMRQGDSLDVIAQKLDLHPDYILGFNDLEKGNTIAIGDTFYIEPKRRFGIPTWHKVKPNETIYKISQSYGVEMESIKKLNQDVKLDSLASGQLIRLNNKK
ncbi:MAG: LysM peptidoglycan-binding domain-containing protein [Cytophagales bacterium]|nr:LysM peptidoglycan-binding domain-containing protein [Cytophagales bacterium]